MKTRRAVVPRGAGSYSPEWERKEKVTELMYEDKAKTRKALPTAIAQAALSVGWVEEASAYLGVRVRALPGRQPGSPSRRRRPVIEGLERLKIAREVHCELGEPQIYEKLERGALKKAVGAVAALRQARTANDVKIIDDCYREFGAKLQSERAFVDYVQWSKGHTAHVIAKAGLGKLRLTRAEALEFHRTRLLIQINRVAIR